MNDHRFFTYFLCGLAAVVFGAVRAASALGATRAIELRAAGVPSPYDLSLESEVNRRVVMAFHRQYPWIDPVSPTGLIMPGGSRTLDMVPMMQIAGDIAPDVLYVNLRSSETYVDKELLYPLDKNLEQTAGVQLPDGSSLSTPAYIAALSRGKNWNWIDSRVLPQCWPVIRRECPYGDDCPYRKQLGLPPLAHHQHVFAFPIAPTVMAIQFDRMIFAEYADQGVQMRTPRDWDELIQWAKIMTRPDRNEYGLKLRNEAPGWVYSTFLYDAGGQVVKQNAAGDWVCDLDSDAAVEAAYFYARLRKEIVTYGDHRTYRGVVAPITATAGSAVKHAMVMSSINYFYLPNPDDPSKGFGPMPRGPTGLQRSEFNCQMMGLFSGLTKDPQRQQAAWDYVKFYNGDEAQRIQTRARVDAGQGTYVRPELLRKFNSDGQYDSILDQIPPESEETYRVAFAGGVPEPYGKNCQQIYDEINKPIGTILEDPTVLRAIDTHDPDLAKPVIRRILQRATDEINQHMLGNLPAPVQQKHERIAWSVVALVVLVFAVVLQRVVTTFRAPKTAGVNGGNWQFFRYRWAYLLMAPAILSIALWAYWPLVSGSAIAFQDYSVLGHSKWVGIANFAGALYDAEFWHSLGVSLTYAGLYMLFGFGAPIALALLLQEVPAGSAVFRTVYYLPAVLSGVVVIFLWKGFYNPDGLVNQILNGGILLLNHLPGVHLSLISESLLDNPRCALVLCLLPTIWAGMGPGCLIYLAALKTIPEELYEAADLDGAGIGRKVFGVALPAIKALVMINFIGAMIGAVRGAGGSVLAMTGGGPYDQRGGATEVIGLKLFYTTFGQLQFGLGAAMAWILGSMLIGFTVIQLQRLRNLEFKTAERG